MKPIFDRTCALLGLLALMPLLAAIALAIWIEDRNSPFYLGHRVGKNCVEFRMLKFRTMRVGAEAEREDLLARNEMDGPTFKMSADPRVTPLGRWQEPQDIAAMVVFLASERARNVTGQTVNVDGGFVMHW